MRWFSRSLFPASSTCIQNVKRIKTSVENKYIHCSREAVDCYGFVATQKSNLGRNTPEGARAGRTLGSEGTRPSSGSAAACTSLSLSGYLTSSSVK